MVRFGRKGRFTLITALAAAAIAAASAPVLAGSSAGELDPSFGAGGKVVDQWGLAGERTSLRTAVVDGEGRIVAGGSTYELDPDGGKGGAGGAAGRGLEASNPAVAEVRVRRAAR